MPHIFKQTSSFQVQLCLNMCEQKDSTENIASHQFPPGLDSPILLFWVPPLSEANFKNIPLFLRAIQIGACKLYETL